MPQTFLLPLEIIILRKFDLENPLPCSVEEPTWPILISYLTIRMLWGSMWQVKVQVSNIFCSPLVYRASLLSSQRYSGHSGIFFFFLVNPCWMFSCTSLLLLSLERTFQSFRWNWSPVSSADHLWPSETSHKHHNHSGMKESGLSVVFPALNVLGCFLSALMSLHLLSLSSL